MEGSENIQQNVWSEVEECLADFEGESESSSLAKGMKDVHEKIKGKEKKINLPKDTCGML